MEDMKQLVRPERVRSIPQSFSWIDREILHRGILERLSTEEILLYFFLILVAGPDGTSFWGYRRIAKMLKVSEAQVVEATRGLIKKDILGFRFPTFQVLSLPAASEAVKERCR
jgi:hypothetical protein